MILSLTDRLLAIGASHQPVEEVQRIRTVNLGASSSVILLLYFTLHFAWLGWMKISLFSVFMAPLYGSSLLLNHFGHTRLSGILLMAVATVQVSVLPLLFLSPETGTQIWLLLIPIVSIMAIHPKDRLWNWIVSGVALSSIGFIEWGGHQLTPIWTVVENIEVTRVLRATNVILTSLLMLIIFWVFHKGIRDEREKVQRLNEQLRGSLKEAETANVAKSAFLAQMSHELRTPLNGILGIGEALHEGSYGELAQQQRVALQYITRSGHRQLTLVNDLLLLSKIEIGQITPNLAPTSLITLCRQLIGAMTEFATEREIKLHLYDDGKTDLITTDRHQLSTMLRSLLDNGIKFSRSNDHVGIEISSTETSIYVAFWDSGLGIPKERIRDLFQPFTQLDPSLTRSHEGSGMGLRLTYKLADLLNGQISVDSREGEGSRFTISFQKDPKVRTNSIVEILEPSSEPFPQRFPLS